MFQTSSGVCWVSWDCDSEEGSEDSSEDDGFIDSWRCILRFWIAGFQKKLKLKIEFQILAVSFHMSPKSLWFRTVPAKCECCSFRGSMNWAVFVFCSYTRVCTCVRARLIKEAKPLLYYCDNVVSLPQPTPARPWAQWKSACVYLLFCCCAPSQVDLLFYRLLAANSLACFGNRVTFANPKWSATY